MSTQQDIHRWYFCPGEKVRSIGFYINPYHRWADAKFKHVFAFDWDNLYIGQFSVYPHHIDEIFGKEYSKFKSTTETEIILRDKVEHGFIHLNKKVGAIVEFDWIECKNIILLNRRLRVLAQRFYDYGMPLTSQLNLSNLDLGYISLGSILKNSPWERPALV